MGLNNIMHSSAVLRMIERISPFLSRTVRSAPPWSALLLLALWTIGCDLKTEAPLFTGKPEKITFCHSVLLDTLILVAHEEGYFKKNGIDISLKKYSTGGRSINRMFHGECDISVSAGTPIVFQSFQHPDLRILSTIGTSDNSAIIVARKDRGIERPEDLEGKKIAVQKGTSFHLFLSLFLTKHGLSEKEVNVIFTRAEELDHETAWERFDAFSTKEPYITQASRFLGENAVIFEDRGLVLVTFNIVTRSAFIEKRPEAVRRLLLAVLEAGEFARNHPDKVHPLIAKTHAFDKETWDLVMADVGLDVTLEQSLLLTLEDEARWAVSEGFTPEKEVPNFLDFIYTSGLESIKPESVTIIR